MFWLGLAIGIFIGANIGIFIMAMTVAASRKIPNMPNEIRSNYPTSPD
jgi:uncharacterized membrane-anchored protein YhcB (DUF1043 family)